MSCEKAKSLADCPSFPKERRREALVEEGGSRRCSGRQRESQLISIDPDDSGELTVAASAARRMATRRRGYLCSTAFNPRRPQRMSGRRRRRRRIVGSRSRARERERSRSNVVSADSRDRAPFCSLSSLPVSLYLFVRYSCIRDRSNSRLRDRPRSRVISRTFVPGWS